MFTAALPAFAAWRFEEIVQGFEVLYVRGRRLRGHTSAVEDGQPYAVRYEVAVDDAWRTQWARVATDTVDGPRETLLESDGKGRWTIDGEPAPHLDGIVDVDLEASACTNLLPVHRMPMEVGETVVATGAWVRALDLSVHRLEQTYTRLDGRRFDYTSEDGDFTACLEYDDAGLILSYPGIAHRVA